eukprot:TRINITY_DN10044_c0_g1_i1.p1 TRINITY_DN10044_c0_g1~~TRINITY_DN10044_c0_g1_i1.p1  ORF type:complete len:332 (-),score=104.35 TRINITY_DN10044_c0_g1_i1:323-1318(-)
MGASESRVEPNSLPAYCKGDVLADQLSAHLKASNFAAIIAQIRAFASSQDWEAKAWYIDLVAKAFSHGRPGWLVKWAKDSPTDADALLLGGAHAIAWAWDARGSGWADSVGEEAFEHFESRLELAEKQLTAAARLAPQDPTALANLLITDRGLEAPLQELRARFRAVVAIAPHHEFAHGVQLQGVCAKWGGCDEEMFAFVRGASANAPAGSGIHSLIVSAHTEAWLQINVDLPASRAQRDAYYTRQDVADEIMAAARNSVLSPDYKPGVNTISHRNRFAFAFWRIGQLALAREQPELLGDRITPSPWCYHGRVMEQVAQARVACGLPRLAN